MLRIPQGWSEGLAAGYRALREGAAMVPRPDAGVVRVEGTDRRSFLQGLLTNDVAALAPGAGCYAAWLTPQGRMIADMHVFETGDAMLLDVARAHAASLAGRLDQLVFSEDAAIRDASDAYVRFTLAGSAAAAAAAVVTAPSFAAPSSGLDVPTFEAFVASAERERVLAALRGAGAVEAPFEAFDVVRIESGTPRFGVDMNEETIPLEAGIESRAISFTKGCYVGQEVIIRVLHRGQGRVAKRLVTLELDAADPSALPAPGTVLQQDGKDVGRLTSVTWSPRAGRGIALGYVQRKTGSDPILTVFVNPGVLHAQIYENRKNGV